MNTLMSRAKRLTLATFAIVGIVAFLVVSSVSVSGKKTTAASTQAALMATPLVISGGLRIINHLYTNEAGDDR
jgi:hypothetical protein